MGAETLAARPPVVNDLPIGFSPENPGKDTASHAADDRYVEDPRQLISGNAVRLLRNGENVFPVWLAAIDSARVRVSMEMYIFNDDAIGRRFADALARAARRGVTVRLLYDYVGCRLTPHEFFQELREAGVRVSVYHGYQVGRPSLWRLFRRNHRKTLVIDGVIGFTGGLNISNEWVAAAEGGEDWRDAVIEVRGPAVPGLETAFAETWNRRSKKRFRLELGGAPPTGRAGDTRLIVLSNTERGERFRIRRAVLHAIRKSRRQVTLANPYFVPDGGILRLLEECAGRGVEVRVLVPMESDAGMLDAAARATFPRLIRAGVRVWRSPVVVHTKVVACDDTFVSIGTYNLDHRSLAYNLELVVNVLDRPFAEATSHMLDTDIAASAEIDGAAFGRRPLLSRALERGALALRRWL
jgi:cardiolipin synthase